MLGGSSMSEKVFPLNEYELLKYQPNRYPFLLIDRVTKYAKGYKNVTNNEWFIPVHFTKK